MKLLVMKFSFSFFFYEITCLHYAAKMDEVMVIKKLLDFPGIDKYKTNKISAAHFRGFGFQNGNLSVESVFERISKIIQDEKKERKSIISICC